MIFRKKSTAVENNLFSTSFIDNAPFYTPMGDSLGRWNVFIFTLYGERTMKERVKEKRYWNGNDENSLENLNTDTVTFTRMNWACN